MITALRHILTAVAVAAIGYLVWRINAGGEVAFTWQGAKVVLASPQWLFVACAVPLIFAYSHYSLTDLSRLQHILQATLRSLVVITIAIALARPTTTSETRKIAIAVLVDVSESVSDAQIAQAKQSIAELERAAPSGSSFQVIRFAGKAVLSSKEGGSWDLSRLAEDGGHTNLQGALHLAYGTFPSGYTPRIALLSDGNATEGDIFAEAQRASEMEIPVSWLPLAANASHEVRIESIEVPEGIKAGEPFNVTLQIWSSKAQSATVSLQQDDHANPDDSKKEVELAAGVTEVTFNSKVPRAGSVRFKAHLAAVTTDTRPENNTAVTAAPVSGKPHILYIEGSLSKSPSSASYLRSALEAQHIDVEVRGPRGLPSDHKQLAKYDLVLVSDVPAKFLSMGQMSALEHYVKVTGGGFIMAGGEDSFGSGGYQGTKIEKLLPVRFDSSKILEQPNVAIVLVLDRSGSMQGDKLEAAKISAKRTAQVLSPHDLIAVIAHDSRPQTVVALQRASSGSRIRGNIERIRSGGGTKILPALQDAYDILKNADARVKHVIVLSDGHAPHDGIASLCDRMRAAGITISTVGIGDADRDLLMMIADRGGGRPHMPDDLNSLPRIFAQETLEAQRSALVEERVMAKVVRRTELIEGSNIASAPALRGYVTTKVKPTADLVLQTNTSEPLLASWRVGAGKSVAWTSDVKNRWSVEWLRWPGYGRFWAQLVRTSMRREIYKSHDLRSEIHGDYARVIVDAFDEDDRFINDLDTTLDVIDPTTDKVIKTYPMQQVASGRYESSFALARRGTYLVKAIHKRDGRTVAESFGAVTLPYPREYSTNEPNTAVLSMLAQSTGGLGPITDAKQAYTADDRSVKFASELWPWFMLLAAGMLIIDLYSKRVRLFGYRVIRFE